MVRHSSPQVKKWPPISIIIVNLNSQKIIGDCLSCIEKQDYPNINEVLIIDGGSTDESLAIAAKSRLPIKIIKGGYKNNQEARRAIGVKKAKNEMCVFLDTDNYILDKKWLKEMIEPLVNEKNVIASQTLRYAVPSGTTIFNRYFGLMGATDPVAYYLGKDDRLSWAFKSWNLLGEIIAKHQNYFIVDFDPENYPTVGCNGVAFRRSILLKAKWKKPEQYIHTDVFVDIGRLGYTKFAIVKNEVFHNTSDNIFNFISKRRRYMKFYHQTLNKRRRHLTFDPHRSRDVVRLFLFVLYSVTIIEPLFQSIRGYLQKKDIAWFLHPVVCLAMMVIYLEATIDVYLKKF